MSPVYAQPNEQGIDLRLKIVPGARQDKIAGILGDRLKIQVSAPPENGRANQAVINLLAKTLGLRPADLTIISGLSDARKTCRLPLNADLTKLP
jgi:uncharacterized protein (TIGR00251 family)